MRCKYNIKNYTYISTYIQNVSYKVYKKEKNTKINL